MSFPKYEAYRDSGVEWLGEVPKHWDIYSLKRSIEGCVNGVWGSEPNEVDDIPVIRVADFERITARVGLSKLTYRNIPSNDRQSRSLQSGDLLIEKSGGGEKTLVGCVVLFKHNFEAVTSNFVARLRPHTKFDSSFLCHAFSALYQGKVNFPSIKQTTGIQNLDSESYLQEYFCFPSFEDQAQISRFLDYETVRIDALIAEQERLIALLKEKRQAVISHAVTKGLDPTVPMKDSGVEWLGEVPEHWNTIRLKYIVPEITVGIVVEPSKYYTNEGIPALRSLNVKPGAIFTENLVYISEESNELQSKSKVYTNDIVAVRSGQPGTAAIIPPELDGCNCIDLIIIRKPLSGHTEFLLRYLSSDAALKQFSEGAAGAIQQHFNISSAANLLISWPAEREQHEISSYLVSVCHELDTLISEAEKSKTLLQERRSALISAAVTGKIDVRSWQPPTSTSFIPTLEAAHH